MGDSLIRAVLIVGGLACVACEMWGAYDFMWQKHGAWNYLVVGSLVLTALAAILPMAAEYAHRRKMRGLKWSAWLGVPIALAFVFTVSIQRTGTVADTDENTRKQIAESIKIAKEERTEALAQLPTDKATVERNCKIWGRICDKAKLAQADTEKKLTAARAMLKKQGVEVDDSMAKRIVAYLPFLTKEQVLLYQPLLLPLGLAVIGSVLIAIGMRTGHKGDPTPGFWARWRARRKPDMSSTPIMPAVIQPDSESAPTKLPPPPRPKLVAASAEPPAGSIPKILAIVLEPAKGERVELEGCYGAYATQSNAEGRRAVSPEHFVDPLKRFCASCRIKTKIEGDLVYLLDVCLARRQSGCGDQGRARGGTP